MSGGEGAVTPTLKTWLKGHYRPSTAHAMAGVIDRYRREVGEAQATVAGYRDVLAYVAGLRKSGLKSKSLHLIVGGVKVYYEWLLDTGQRGDHPCRTMRLADAVDRQIRLDELYTTERLDDLATGYRSADPLDQRRGEVIVGLIVNQALTAGEVTRLRVGDIDLEAGTVYVGAGGKTAARTLALRGSQVLTLWRYVEEDRGRYVAMATARDLRADWLAFDTKGGQLGGGELNRLINQGRKKADKLRPQKIRQTVIAGLVAAGHDIRIVQAFAGHRRSSATEEYKRTGLEELAEAVVKLHPRG